MRNPVKWMCSRVVNEKVCYPIVVILVFALVNYRNLLVFVWPSEDLLLSNARVCNG